MAIRHKQVSLEGKEVETPVGYIKDYISGQSVKANPEETEAVQIFSKKLVEDYDYSKSQIQTHPQFRIKSSPSGTEKYPVDIAVFKNDQKTYGNLFMIVECKRKNRNDGLKQLKIYMSLSGAQIGIWFNGKEHVYLQKLLDKQGNVTYRELPNIPKNGQRVEDIGKYYRKNLKAPTDLKVIFRDIRNHLAGMTTGITRDEAFAQEVINILFCKIYDELNTAPNEEVNFRAGVDESPNEVKKRISHLFENKVKQEYSDVFDKSDSIKLDANSLVYAVGELQNYSIMDADRDAIGDAFEVFIGPTLRGGEGQFFTPRNVVQMMMDILDPSPGDSIIDPACGSGGFLIMALAKVWAKMDEEGKRKNWSRETLAIKKRENASKFFCGIDKDNFLAKVTKAYMALVGDGRGGVFCENSLKPLNHMHHSVTDKINLEKFDIVITNPPFGSKIQVSGEELLSQYDLAREWKKDEISDSWIKGDKLRDKQAPQTLFIERCIQLLKPGGKLGIILPETIFGNPSHGYIVEYIKQNTKFLGLVSLPEELFQPYTHSKTCVLFLEKIKPRTDYRIFMGIAKWCGHDSRGNKIPLDDVPLIAPNYTKITNKKTSSKYSRFGFHRDFSEMKNNIIIPKYYDPEIESELDKLKSTHDLIAFGELVNKGIISLSTGVEIGKLSYGTGTIPFIRTSDLTNWELKIDPKHGVDEKIYKTYSKKCDLKENDILMVRDGTYLIGTTCILTKHDVKSLFQSHIYKIRVLKPEIISPHLLLVLLNSPIVKKQIRAKQFTQDIIDTLGKRILEIILPVPKDNTFKKKIEESAKNIIEERAELRNKAKKISIEVLGKEELTDEEKALMEQL
jgi:type I restriction enzyme M protein